MRTWTRLSLASVAGASPILMLVTPAQAALTDHALWQMETLGTAIDSSGNSNDGVLHGAISLTSGFLGNGYHFSGAGDYVEVANSPSLNPGTADFSVTTHV